jgi:Domain of unknown function (DUF4405)
MTRFKVMLCIDILLIVIFILLFSPLMTGLALHELLGIIFFLPVITHLLFSWPWIKQSAKRFVNDAGWRNRFNYILNAGLFILIVLMIVSGLVISQVALPFLGIKTINDVAWRALHNGASNVAVIAVSLHIAINWQRIVGYFKKRVTVIHTANRKFFQTIVVFKIGLLRICIIILASVIIASILFLILGSPAATRLIIENEIARFIPRLLQGVVQFAGTAITIAILAYIARRWLKLRL